MLTLVFGIAVFLFWRYRYPFALTYQEQLQLFLFDGDYFWERMTEPGGFARYIAEFLVQFYNAMAIGALILAVLFVLVQRLTWRLMKTHQSPLTSYLYPLSFIPALILWFTMGDESVMLTYVVALVMALAAALLFRRLELVVLDKLARLGKLVKLGILLFLIPLLYWLIGPMVLLVAALMLPWTVAVGAVVYALALILLSAHWLPFPMSRVLLGISYYRYPEVLPYMLMVIPVVVLLLVWFSRKIHHLSEKGKKWLYVAELVVIVVAAVLTIPRGFDAKKYELIEYDFLVRTNQWSAIIAKAEKQMPDLPMSVSATNLALGMTNQLGERAFDFYQRGSEGLLPKFERNFSTTQLTGEIYFHLGLVNTAQRFAFEAMEALKKNSVDIMLLDIQMPDLTGLELVKSLEKKPAVIFTTAYSEYAVDAFNLAVSDYLLKPFDFPRFFQAINKAIGNVPSRSENAPKPAADTISKSNDFITVKADYKLYKINYDDLLFIEGQHEYVTFHTTQRRITALFALKDLEEILPKDKFVRVHKSYIVSFKHIQDLDKSDVTVAGNKVPVGASYRDELLARLQ